MPPKERTMSSKGMMTPGLHPNPSRRSSPKSVPPAAPSRPKAAPNTPTVPASTSASQGLVERPYAPVLPPSTSSHDRETVEALVGLAASNQLSPTTGNLTSSFSAIDVAIPNGLPNPSKRTASQYEYSGNIPSPGIHSDEYPSDAAEDTRNTDASSTRSRRRRRSNSFGVESPRDHTKPYDGHVLKEDIVMDDATSPWNHPQAPQQGPRRVPHLLLPKSMAPSGRVNKSKHHPHSQRMQLPSPHSLLQLRAQPALVNRSQQPTVRHPRQTNKPQMPKTESPRMYATDVDGYKVLRGAVSVELAQAAADIIDRGLKVFKEGPPHKSFILPTQAYRVRDEFIRTQVQNEVVGCFRPPSPSYTGFKGPTSTIMSKFVPAPDPRHAMYCTPQVGEWQWLYVVVALTHLEFENGLYEFLGGSHANKKPGRTIMDHWNRVRNDLNPGDALIWRGDLVYLLSPHGGGKYLTLTFEWFKDEQPVVDLTR